MRLKPFRTVAAGIAAFLVFQTASFGQSQGPLTDPSRLKEIDWSGMSDAQKTVALRLMNTNGCNCRCKMTIATCRASDETCRRSLIFARTIIDAVREGKPEGEVARILKAKTDEFVEAKLPDDTGVAHTIDVSHNPVRGPKDAKVEIVEFSDFQCPFCHELQAVLDQVLKAFPKEVRLVFKQYPLNIHQYARQAAVASMAAHAQGKFWQLHDKMFQNFNLITEENITRWAREVGLNMTEFEKAMQSGVLETQVQKDMTDGATAGVLGTPTLFVNGKRIHDRSFEGFKKAILEELATAKSPSVPPGKTSTKARISGH